MIEFMIMMFIMIWVIPTRMKILLGQFWGMRRGLILGAVELADLQQSQVCCSLKCYSVRTKKKSVIAQSFMFQFLIIANTIYVSFDLHGNEIDPFSESRIEKPHPVYVPRDETFEEIKQNTFSAGRMKAMLHNLIPSIAATMSSSDIPFKCFSDIDKLYSDGFLLKDEEHKDIVENPLVGSIMKQVMSIGQTLLKYEIPAIIKSSYACSAPSISFLVILRLIYYNYVTEALSSFVPYLIIYY